MVHLCTRTSLPEGSLKKIPQACRALDLGMDGSQSGGDHRFLTLTRLLRKAWEKGIYFRGFLVI